MQAGLLRVRLKHLNSLNEEKQKIAERYTAEIVNPIVKLPSVFPGATSVWHQYVVRCNERDSLMEYLNKKEIGTIIHYPIPPHLSEAYKYLGHIKGDYPITENYSDTILSLPMYNGMTYDEQSYVIDAINNFR